MRIPSAVVSLTCCVGVAIALGGCGSQDHVSPSNPSSHLDIAFAAEPVAAPLAPQANDVVTVTFQVLNHDDDGSTLSGVGWTVSRDGVAGYAGGTIATIPAGTAVTESFTAQEASGSHTYRILLDPTGQFSENDEGNNTRDVIVQVDAPLPNLAFSGLPTVTPAVPTTSSTISVQFTVTNTGTAAASDVAWSMAHDGLGGFRSGLIPSLPAGASVIQTVSFTEIQSGPHNYEIVLDPSLTITETSEGDNVQDFSIQVAPIGTT